MKHCVHLVALSLVFLPVVVALAASTAWATKPLALALAPARSVSGIVSQVIDGSTLRLSPPDQPTLVVRLIDGAAPEPCQVGGEQARLSLAEWVLNQSATLQVQGRDREGRTLGTLRVNGLDINRHMVEEGRARSTRGRNGHGPMLKQERDAKALGRGLHAQRGAMRPSEFRRLHGPCGVK